jgi:hypothetical protein
MSTAVAWVIAVALMLIAFALFAIGDKLGRIAEALRERRENDKKL